MSEVDSRTRTIDGLLLCLAGPIVWAAHFFIMYGTGALTCAVAPASARNTIFQVIGTATTVIAVATLIGLVVRGFARSRSRRHAESDFAGSSFLRHGGIALAGLALLGVLWVALPTAFLAACR
jgi:hypothetical protein